MKKILIIMPSMFIGGAERSLLGLLEGFDYTKVEVNLFLYRHEGEFLKYIPEQVCILPEVKQYRTFDTPIKSLIFSKQFIFGLARIFSKVVLSLHCLFKRETSGVWMSMQYTARFLQPFLPKIRGEYDLGIMYLGIADTLINKVEAKCKMTWNHTDYDSLHPNRKMDIETYNAIDWLVSVSESCTKKVHSYYPQFNSKAITIENCLARRLIMEQASELIEDFNSQDDEYTLLSIGRFSDAKNFDNVPDICRRIIENGFKIKWYLIGYGADEGLIKRKIAEAGVEKYVILLGKKDNPYPYIRSCDLYVQPSRYEGKCVAVREAQTLCKPVVITRYETSASQLEDGIDGVIVQMDNEGCANGIMELLNNSRKMLELSKNCAERDYTNSKEIEKIYKVLGV